MALSAKRAAQRGILAVLAIVATTRCQKGVEIQVTQNLFSALLSAGYEQCTGSTDLIFLMLDDKSNVMVNSDPNFRGLGVALEAAGGGVAAELADITMRNSADAGVTPVSVTISSLKYESNNTPGTARDLVVAFDHGGSFAGVRSDGTPLTKASADGGTTNGGSTDPSNARVTHAKQNLLSTTFLNEGVNAAVAAFPITVSSDLVPFKFLSADYSRDSTSLGTLVDGNLVGNSLTPPSGGTPLFAALANAASSLRGRGSGATPSIVAITDGRDGPIQGDGGAAATFDGGLVTQQTAVDYLKKVGETQAPIATVLVGMHSYIPTTDTANSLDEATLRAMVCSLNAAVGSAGGVTNPGSSTYVDVADPTTDAFDISRKLAAAAQLTRGRFRLALTVGTPSGVAGTYVVSGALFARPTSMTTYLPRSGPCATDTDCSFTVVGSKCRSKNDGNPLDKRCYMPFEFPVVKP